VKPNINSVEVHPQLSNNGHPVHGALVGLWLDFGLPTFGLSCCVRAEIVCSTTDRRVRAQVLEYNVYFSERVYCAVVVSCKLDNQFVSKAMFVALNPLQLLVICFVLYFWGDLNGK